MQPVSEGHWGEGNLSQTDVKRQHYVPKMYLDSFAGHDGKIRVVDLDTDSQYRTSLLNVALETHFNDVEINGVKLSTEEWLSDIEGKAAPILSNLIENPESISSLTPIQQNDLGRFVTALKFRVPAFRIWSNSVSGAFGAKIKEHGRAFLFHNYAKAEAETIWEEWKNQPDEWWLNEPEPQPAGSSAAMLEEIQGFTNLLWGRPWRIGRAPVSTHLYASDNPVSEYVHPVREWWNLPTFSSVTHYLPLSPMSPNVLLKFEPLSAAKDDDGKPMAGSRVCRNFTREEISFARHTITNEATTFLYGDGLVVPRDCADSCVRRINSVRLEFAKRFLGFDPKPPPGFAPPL
jgi:hypothetical protein